jgi:hypothetical protein
MALDESQYKLVMDSLSHSQVELAKSIVADPALDDKDAVHGALEKLVGIDMIQSAWDMTRENVFMTYLPDITDRLKEDNPWLLDDIARGIRKLEWFHVYKLDAEGNKESFMASSGGKGIKDGNGVVVKPVQAVIDACAVLCVKIASEHDVDLSGLTDHSAPNITQKTARPNVEADVESFKAEMNAIFATWGGGET